MTRMQFAIMSVVLLLACGGGASEETPPGASIESEGGEDFAPPATHAESEPEPQAGGEVVEDPSPAAGPSTIRVQVSVKGQPVGAEIRIMDGDDVIASGQGGEPITASAGDYNMVVNATDGLVDHPEQHRRLTLLPGGDVEEKVELPWAFVQLRVRVNGNVNRGATVEVMRDGEVVATFKSEAPHQLISPGRYQAVVRVRGAKIAVPELMFPAESTKTVPVSVQM